jgi:hypothetical protein
MCVTIWYIFDAKILIKGKIFNLECHSRCWTLSSHLLESIFDTQSVAYIVLKRKVRFRTHFKIMNMVNKSRLIKPKEGWFGCGFVLHVIRQKIMATASFEMEIWNCSDIDGVIFSLQKTFNCRFIVIWNTV